MADNVSDAVPQVLQSIQRDLADLRASMDRQFGEVRGELSGVADVLRKQRRDTAGLLVMAKSLAGNFAEELAAVEERVSALEAAG